jgi:phosphatidylserine/phosphatidylglycerophosphate/cardiolipin synthase-like enzyme
VRLAQTQGVETRVKASGDGFMHMKSYSVSGALLRTGSANESVSGLEHQDNDLVIISDRAVVAAFDRKFQLMWNRPTNVKSLRMVEEMLAARGICVSYETVRQWGKKFGKTFSDRIRQRAPARGDKWHMDEVVVSIAGETHLP